MPRIFGFEEDTARRLKRLVGGPVQVGTARTEPRRRPQILSELFFFRLLEDAAGLYGPAWARETDRLGTVDGRVFQLYWWNSLLDGAVAGYLGTCASIQQEMIFNQGPCIVECHSDGIITPGTSPSATVGSAYSHTVGNSDVTGLSASGLPAGLSMDSAGAITGTPTAAGKYYPVITGSAVKTGPEADPSGNCLISKVLPITVAEAE